MKASQTNMSDLLYFSYGKIDIEIHIFPQFLLFPEKREINLLKPSIGRTKNKVNFYPLRVIVPDYFSW